MEHKGDITFRDLTNLWLKETERTKTLRSVESLQKSLVILNKDLGDHKLTDFDLKFVQIYFSRLETKTFEVGYAVSRKDVRSVLWRHGFTRKKLRMEMGIFSSTLAAVFNHSKIAKKWAMSFSEKTEIPYEELFDDHGCQQKYSSSTVQGYKSVVRCALAFAKKQGYIKENYARKKYIKGKGCTIQKPVPPCKEELLKVLQAISTYQDIRVRASALLMLCTHFDCKQVAVAEWKNFDFDKQTITIFTAGNESKTIIVPKDIMTIFKKYKDWQSANEHFSCDYLFTQKNGANVGPHTVSAWFIKVVKQAGIKSFVRDFKALKTDCIYIKFDWKSAPDVVLAGRQKYYQDPMRKEMVKLGFRTYNDYLEYLEFVAELDKKTSKMSEME